MKICEKTTDFVKVEFSTQEYEAFVQILQLQRKDYKGGK